MSYFLLIHSEGDFYLHSSRYSGLDVHLMLQHTPLGFRIPYGFKSHTCMYVRFYAPSYLYWSIGQYLLAEYVDVHSLQKSKKIGCWDWWWLYWIGH
jgi:hypothetical protein